MQFEVGDEVEYELVAPCGTCRRWMFGDMSNTEKRRADAEMLLQLIRRREQDAEQCKRQGDQSAISRHRRAIQSFTTQLEAIGYCVRDGELVSL